MFILFQAELVEAAVATSINIDGKELNEDKKLITHVDGRVYIPVRYIAEHIGGQVEWNTKQRKVTFYNKQNKVELWLDAEEYTVNGATRKMDAKPHIKQNRTMVPVRFVADGLGLNVRWDVLNRVKSSGFPNNVYDVVFDKYDNHYQFEPVQNGDIQRLEPNEASYTAAKRALAGEDPTNGALFFHNPITSKSDWMAEKPVTIRIGKHEFMY